MHYGTISSAHIPTNQAASLTFCCDFLRWDTSAPKWPLNVYLRNLFLISLSLKWCPLSWRWMKKYENHWRIPLKHWCFFISFCLFFFVFDFFNSVKANNNQFRYLLLWGISQKWQSTVCCCCWSDVTVCNWGRKYLRAWRYRFNACVMNCQP